MKPTRAWITVWRDRCMEVLPEPPDPIPPCPHGAEPHHGYGGSGWFTPSAVTLWGLHPYDEAADQ